MFDIAKAVEETKRAREKIIKNAIKNIKRQIKNEIKEGNTRAYILFWNDNEEATRIMKYFKNKGFVVSSHKWGKDIDIEISWDYVEGDK